MSELRALLFDVDGTLAETERDGHRVAFNRAFTDHGLAWQWDRQRYGTLLQITGGRERIEHFAGEHDPRWLARADAQPLIAEIHRRKNRHYAELVQRGRIALRPGLQALLAQARAAGLLLGIVTTTSRDNLDALIDASLDADTRDALRLRIAGEDVKRKKPDPECYALALAALGLPADQVLAVEDSRNGLRAASGAGLRTLIVRSHYFRDEDFGEAAAVIDEFTETRLDQLQQLFAARSFSVTGLSPKRSTDTVAPQNLLRSTA